MATRVIKIVLVVLLLMLAVLVLTSVVFWRTQGPIVAKRIEDAVQRFVISNDSTRIEIENISGNPFGSVTLHGVRLLTRDGDGWKSFVRARKVSARFRVSDLARKRLVLQSVVVEQPVLSIVRGARGDYLWPRFGSDAGRKRSKGKLALHIEELILKEGSVDIDRRHEDLRFEEIDLHTGVRSDSSGFRLTGFSLSCSVLPWSYVLSKCQGDLQIVGGKLLLEQVEVRTPKSSYAVDGFVALRDPVEVSLVGQLHSLSLAEMKGLDFLSFLPEDGTVEGTLKVTKVAGGTTEVVSSVSGTYGPHRLDSVTARTRVARGRWGTDFRLSSDGSVLDGVFDSAGDSLQECRVDFEDFDPGGWADVFGQERIPHGLVSGGFRFAGRGLTSPSREGRLEISLDPGQYAGVSFVKADMVGAFDGHGTLNLTDLEVEGTRYAAKASGHLGAEGGLEIRFDFSVLGLEEFPGVSDALKLESDLQGTGTLLRSGEKLTIDGTFRGRLESMTPSLVSGEVAIGRLSGELWPEVSLQTGATLCPARVGGVVFDSLMVEAGVFEQGEGSTVTGRGGRVVETVLAYVNGNARAVRSDTSITAAGVVAVSKDGVGVSLDALELSLGQKTWKNEQAVDMFWQDGRLRLEGVRLSSAGEGVQFDGVIGAEERSVSGKLTLSSLDLRDALGAVWPVAGRLNARLDFGGQGDEQVVEAEVEWLDASVAGRGVDRVSLSGRLRGSELAVNRLTVTKGGGVLTGSGRIGGPCELKCVIDSLMSGRRLPEGIMTELDFSTEGLAMERFSGWHPALAGVGGIVDSKLRISGTLERPDVRVSLDAYDLRLREYEVERLHVEGQVSEQVCNVTKLEVNERNAKGEASGFLPMSVNLCVGSVSFPDGPVRFRMKLSESDFSVASLFLRHVASSSGVIVGDAELTGTLRNPVLNGSFNLTNGTLRLAGRNEVLKNLQGHVVLNEKAVELVRFSANLDEGRIEGGGRIVLSEGERGHYNFTLKGRKVSFGDPEDIALKFDCNLEVSSVELKEMGIFPKISGRIDVKQGLIAREFQASASPQPEQRWLCDIEVDVPNNLWLKNINAEIELAGSVRARKDISGLVLLGSLRILRGKYYIFDNEFRIISGNMEFQNVEHIDPEMNIEAETNASGRRITLALSGKLSEPNIVFSSEDPNLSQADILHLLTVGKYVYAEPSGSQDGGLMPGVTGSVGNYFLRQIERRVARELRWIDSIELGSGIEGGGSLGELRWGVGKYVTPELFLRYSQGFSRSSERDVSIEYRLSQFLFLRGTIVSRDRLTGREKDEYNLDLRLKYEY
ncbi:MAG: translocation/assembly module TamB domain-containing protein [Candidatus Eisenbacteria bacterium]